MRQRVGTIADAGYQPVPLHLHRFLVSAGPFDGCFGLGQIDSYFYPHTRGRLSISG
jgi:hypothetical protein